MDTHVKSGQKSKKNKIKGKKVCLLVSSKLSEHRLEYLPANCLIGELLHPIELLLHFRSLACLVFRSNALKPGFGLT